MCLLLSGCGMQFAYNNARFMASWYLNDFIDLSREQKTAFKAELAQLHDWHRANELPLYRDTLVQIRAQLSGAKLDPDALQGHIALMRQRWDAIVIQATPAIVELSRTVTPQQVQGLMLAVEARSQERLSDAETAADHAQDTVAGIEKWTGPLSPSQQTRVLNFAAQYPDITVQTVAAHRAFQSQLFEVLAEPSGADRAARLGSLFANALDTPQGRQLVALRAARLDGRVQLMTDLWAGADERQKRRVIKRVGNYIDDMDALINTELTKAVATNADATLR
ncbi:DUF6279 family lipoprotein [Litorivicinus lipolyticus]|uniref:DUF6279 family lipoprotein n=1 Tax=Litorivicinus lipolyticus TaxID=418701 RepID=UPI003B5A74E4